MIRSCLRLSGALVLSVAVSLSLVPAGGVRAQSSDTQSSDTPSAEAPAQDAVPPASETSSGSSSDTASETPAKGLETIPEDGMGDTVWLSGATRIVRELTALRPKEDLVICIAGCVEKQDRVVFAQPAEMPLKKPVDTMSDAGPAVTPPAVTPPAVTPKAAETPAMVKPAEAAAAAASGPVSGPASAMKKSEFEPSMAQPKAMETPAASTPAVNAPAPKLETVPAAASPAK